MLSPKAPFVATHISQSCKCCWLTIDITSGDACYPSPPGRPHHRLDAAGQMIH